MTAKRHTSRKAATVRHGSIKAPGFSAVEYKGSQPAFRGRIAVDRGSGMVEFPNATQLTRILREEGIDAAAGEQAFGHMGGKRRTSKKINRNGPPSPRSTQVTAHRGGFVSAVAYDPYTGEKGTYTFTEYTGKDERQRYSVIIDRQDKPNSPTMTVLPQHIEEMLVKGFGIPQKIINSSFGGILKSGKVLPKISQAMEMYGGKSTKLGHFGASGRPVAGMIPGALVAFNVKSGQVIVTFEINPGKADPGKPDAENPIRWGKGWLGGSNPGGRALTWNQAYAKAQEFGIPEAAFLRSFGHLLPSRKRNKLWDAVRGGGRGTPAPE